jgi:Predicted hydrolase (HAD superfamily)
MKSKKVFIFDAYGTLLDIDSACRKMADKLGENWITLSSIWRQKQLEYSWLRNSMDSYIDFWEITKNALNYAMEFQKIKNDNIKNQLLNAYF